MDLKEIGCGGVDWIQLDRVEWQALEHGDEPFGFHKT
jgi:hypothetical protein